MLPSAPVTTGGNGGVVYGQPQGPSAPPYVPMGSLVGPRPPKPGPTGTRVAITSAAVPVVYLVAQLLLTLLWKEVGPSLGIAGLPGHSGYWIFGISFVALGIVPLGYLFVVGRGSLGRYLGGGLIAAAILLAVVRVTVVSLVGRASWLTYLGWVIGFLTVVLVVTGWGIARRDGRLWTLSIPVGILCWALWTFLLSSTLIGYLPYRSGVVTRFLVLTLPSILVIYVIPIAIGWGLELLGRAASSNTTPGPGAPPAPRPVAQMPSQPQQGHWQWHPGPQQAQRPQPQQPPSHPPRQG